MTTKTLTTNDRLTIVKLLADGRDPDFVATATQHERETVLNVGASHGYPDTSKLSWAVDVLTRRVADESAGGIPAAQHTRPADLTNPPARPPVPMRPSSTSAGASGRPNPTPAPAAAADPVAALLAAGKKSTRARTRSLAERAEKAIDLLRAEVEAEQERKKAAAAQAAAEAKVRSEIARLEKELAAQRSLLPKHKAAAKGMVPAASTGTDPKAVRAWARDNDVECPAAGRVPRRVVDAYLAAQNGAAA